jgi:hypothetical protein
MDNINLYRGRRRHLRLLKSMGPKMWNFTGRAAIIPDTQDIQDLLLCQKTATLPKADISTVNAESIPLGKKKLSLHTTY